MAEGDDWTPPPPWPVDPVCRVTAGGPGPGLELDARELGAGLPAELELLTWHELDGYDGPLDLREQLTRGEGDAGS